MGIELHLICVSFHKNVLVNDHKNVFINNRKNVTRIIYHCRRIINVHCDHM